jgi:hypothetical protein
MTDKQTLIIDYLESHDGQGYFIKIRDNIDTMQFESSDDFWYTIYQLEDLNLIYENDKGDTLYKLTFPNLKVKYAIPHVTLFYSDKDEPLLRIEDNELYNTVDNILTDQYDINDYYYTTERTENLDIYTIHFPNKTDKDKLNKAIRSIDKGEVERIYKINNPNDTKTYR